MDFNTIYAAIQPYVGTGTIGAGIIAVVAFCLKAVSVFKDMRNSFRDTNKEAIDRFKAALPSDLTISLEQITKQELDRIKGEIRGDIIENFITPIKANTELCRIMAEALACSKLIPDSQKEQIRDILALPDEKVETTASLKVSLVQEEAKKEEKKQEEPKPENKNILVD